MFIFVTSPANYSDDESKHRQDLCLKSLERLSGEKCSIWAIGGTLPNNSSVSFLTMTRTAKSVLGYDRDIPFIRDILRMATRISNHKDDWIIYLNSDIIVNKKILNLLESLNKEALIGKARQINSINTLEETKNALCVSTSNGYEIFGFRKNLFEEIDKRLPDFLVGEYRWDLYMANLLQSKMDTIVLNNTDYFYHIYHEQSWFKRTIGSYYNLHLSDPELFTKKINDHQDPYGMPIRKRSEIE